ncbi:MAG: hypothetical protein JW860_00405 [Sedimentisphaerales bacterium]|nr:hypothetical protein [Sedimentisphaerales bacterium]
MKKLLATVFVLTVSLSSFTFAATYGGGDGTLEAPYRIGSLAHWQTLMNTPEDWGSSFILTTDLNWDGLTLTPLGNNSASFTGNFNGNGHTIRNAVIYQPDNDSVGLFHSIGWGAQIMNLGLENISITGNNGVGSFAGINNGTLKACYAKCTVNGFSAGGLVGFNFSSIISCYSKSSVRGTDNVGGLVSSNSGRIASCYFNGTILILTDYPNFCGGLVGQEMSGGTENSFWDIQTSGQMKSGGGTGLPTATMQNPETYLRAYWDFKGEIANGTEDIWTMPEGGGYPILSWQVQAASLANDEMAGAIPIHAGESRTASSAGATGLDLTAHGYNDSKDIWYVFTPATDGTFTITVFDSSFDATLGVFDAIGREVVFNDDFFGEKSVVILKAKAGKPYYLRIAGHDGQTGSFTLAVDEGAIQAIQGDLNYDGCVNLPDLAIFAANWLS